MNILDLLYFYVLGPLFSAIFLLYKVEISGKENIPPDKGFILAANHNSFLDGPFIAWALYTRHVHWIVAKWVYHKWYFHPLCAIARCVPVNGTVEAAQKVLSEGRIIGIFPYGGICCDKIIQKGKKGVAVLALKTGVPVVPCYIESTLTPGERVHLAPKIFAPLKLRFGQPINFAKCLDEKIPREMVENTLSKIIGAINALAPRK